MSGKKLLAALPAAIVGSSFLAGQAFGADFGPYVPYTQEQVEKPTSWEVDTSGDFVEDAYVIMSGVVVSLNGDSSRSGYRLSVTTGYGDYDYDSDDVPGGRVDADVWIASVLLGYQFYSGNIAYTIYGGADYQDTELTPNDPSNETRGSEFGAKVSGEIEYVGEGPFYFDLNGEYSTVFETYWARGRLGYNFGNFVVGPEGTLLGDETYDSQRVGAFVSFPIHLTRDMPIYITLAGGYAFVDDDDNNDGGDFDHVGGLGGSSDSAYFGFDISSNF